MNSKQKIMIVDDAAPFCQLVQYFLGSSDEYAVVAAFQDPIQALEEVGRLRPDIVVIDLRMPGISGLECMKRMQQMHPEVRFLLVTGLLRTLNAEESALAHRLAQGFLEKPFLPEELKAALKLISCGDLVRSRGVEEFLYSSIGNSASGIQSPSSSTDSALSLLSPRERQIMNCLAKGLRYKEVALELRIESNTVHVHLSHIYKKLCVRNKYDAVQKCFPPSHDSPALSA